MQRIARHIGVALGLLGLFAVTGEGEVERLVIGRGGLPWGEIGEEIAALEDTTAAGSLQPREFKPWENVLVGDRGESGQYRNLLGYDWAVAKTGKGTSTFKMGLTPRLWQRATGDYAKGVFEFIDGNPDNAINRFKRTWTFDLGIPVPLSRIVFYAPRQGMGVHGEAFKNMFPREYEVTGLLDPVEYLLLTEETEYHPLEVELGKTYYNNRRAIELDFEPMMLRFFRLFFGLRLSDKEVEQSYTLSEIEAYAEGFPTRTWYISRIIDMGEPVNFGSILWGFSRFRKDGVDALAELDPQAPVRLSLETRSGRDETPMAYHVTTEIGKEREVPKAEYDAALAPSLIIGALPGNRGSVTDDADNWSFWSPPYRYSGQPVESPDARRYLKLQFVIESDDVFAFGRLDSIAIEYSPLLVEQVLGEVALHAQPQPERGVVEVPAGRDTLFTYDVLPTFSSASQVGFDAIRLLTPSAPEFVGLEMGNPLAPVAPDSVREGECELVIYFPSQPIAPGTSQPVRILFRSAVLSFSSYFTGEVFDSASGSLAQSIDPGDANPDVATNGVQVFSSVEKLQVLSSLRLTPRAFSPNGDGINDQASISFVVLGVQESGVKVGVFDVSGREVRRLATGNWGQKAYEIGWDGTAANGSRVPPGVYLCRVSVETDTGVSAEIRSVAVAY